MPVVETISIINKSGKVVSTVSSAYRLTLAPLTFHRLSILLTSSKMPKKLTKTRRPRFELKLCIRMMREQHGRRLETTESKKYSPRPQLGILDDTGPKARALKLQDNQPLPNATFPPSLKPAPHPLVAVHTIAANAPPEAHTPLAHP
jgi:hypothetical protein